VDETVTAAQAEGFGLGATELERMVQGQDTQSLMAYGGVQGVALALGVPDTVKGIKGTPEELEKRLRVYGPNTFPDKPEKGFFSFVWDAMQVLYCTVMYCTAGVTVCE